MSECTERVNNFKDGQLSKFIENCKVITHDKNILDMIAYGDTIGFEDYILSRHSCLNQYNTEEENLILPEVEKMLRKGIIVECSHEEREYVSPIFITQKSDGGVRLTLNLKKLNEKIKLRNFKMQAIKDALLMINKGDFLTKIDLKDAYYSVQIHKKY